MPTTDLDRIASAVVNLDADGRTRLLSELREISAVVEQVASRAEERSAEPAATPSPGSVNAEDANLEG